jgi:hypothetical protein
MTALTNKALLAQLAQATGLDQVPADPTQATAPFIPLPAQIAALQGIDTPDADGLPTDIGGLRTLIRTMLGQPQMPTGTSWPMSANRSATRLNLLEPRVALLEQLVQQYAAGATATDASVKELTARLSLLSAAQAAADARQTADEVRLAAVEAKATLTASATEANRLELIKNAAADALRDARLTNDEALIAAAQATATQAKADAATAQKLAADDAAALTALQGQLATVQATANAAQAAAAANAIALAGKLDASAVQRFTVATPAVSLVVGTPYAVPVTLPKAWTNGNYLVFLTKASGSTLLNVSLSDTAKTATGFTLTMQTTGLATLAVGASSAEVLAIQL